MANYRVWSCKIVVDVAGTLLPDGFDWPPRSAAVQAVEIAGIPVVACFSGWGGSLTKSEIAVIEGPQVEEEPPHADAKEASRG